MAVAGHHFIMETRGKKNISHIPDVVLPNSVGLKRTISESSKQRSVKYDENF
jgi:hypothetical protein